MDWTCTKNVRMD